MSRAVDAAIQFRKAVRAEQREWLHCCDIVASQIFCLLIVALAASHRSCRQQSAQNDQVIRDQDPLSLLQLCECNASHKAPDFGPFWPQHASLVAAGFGHGHGIAGQRSTCSLLCVIW